MPKQKDITRLNSDIVDSLDAVFKSRLLSETEKEEALDDAIIEAAMLITELRKEKKNGRRA